MKTRRAFMHSLVAAALVPFMRRARARTELTPVQAFSVYNGFRFGWIRELPSLKKDTFVSPFALGEPLPTKVDLRSKMAPVYDQGDLGSCTSNAVAAMVQFVRKKSGEAPDFVPSRLFIYYNGRAIENSIEKDNGLQIRDGITVVENLGVCPEAEWPYDAEPANREGKFPANSRAVIKPPKVIFNEAYPHRAVDAFSIPQRVDPMRACLAAGFPFSFGFTVYPSFFDSAKKPLATIPLPSRQEIPIAGHAVVAVGYDDSTELFVCRNSWGVVDKNGRQVQEKGHFYMPYRYLTDLDLDLAADFWTIRAVQSLT